MKGGRYAVNAVKLLLIFMVPLKGIAAGEVPGPDITRINDNTVSAEGLLEAPFSKIWDVLTDYSRAEQYLPNIKKSDVLEVSGNVTVVETTVRAAFYKIKYTARMIEDRKNGVILWRQTEGEFTLNKGSWILQREGTGRTRVTYTVSLDHPYLPRWIKSLLIRRSIPEMFRRLEKAAE